jgi:signal transduction histidine kinase
MMKPQEYSVQFDILQKRQRLVRAVIFVSLPMLFISVIPEMIYGVYTTLYMVSGLLFLTLLSLYFNYRNHINASGQLLVIVFALAIYFQSLQFGGKTYTFCYYFPLMFGVPFILDRKKGRLLIINLFLLVLLFTSVFFIPPFGNVGIHNEYFELNKILNITISFFLLGFFLVLMLIDAKKSETKMMFSNKMIEHDYQELLKSNEELDHIVYSISHNLRAPIATSLGLVEISKKENRIESLKKYLSMNESSLLKSNQYIANILEFVKNNSIDLSFENVLVYQELLNAIEQNMTSDSHVRFEIECLEQQEFLTDKVRFNLILNNLISNAIKFSNKENAVIEVSFIENKYNYLLTIKDFGVGIEEALQSKVFEMFYKLSTTNSGSGLGLYITKKAVDKLNGTIDLFSVANEGTTFIVKFKKG